jgi:hypothetical protein
LPTLRVRVVCKQPDGTPLVEAAAKQLVFNLREEEGDLVSGEGGGSEIIDARGKGRARRARAP